MTMTVVAILALDGVVPFELSIPGQVFGAANLVLSTAHYEIRVCAERRTITTSTDHGAFSCRRPGTWAPSPRPTPSSSPADPGSWNRPRAL